MRTRRDWKSGELQYLKDNYGRIPVRAIARELDRTSASIRGMANRQGISKKLPRARGIRHAHRRCPECKRLYGGGKCPRCKLEERRDVR